MRITVRGWGRDLGETEVMNAAIAEAENPPDRLSQGKLYKNLDYLDDKRFTKARLYGSADMRLGGTYLLKVELSRKEIAELFFDTHKGTMIRMIQSFIEEEEREERAQMLADLARVRERRRQRLAREAEESETLPPESSTLSAAEKLKAALAQQAGKTDSQPKNNEPGSP